MKKIFLKIIRVYQNIISPLLGKRCRFYPSCSQYTYLSITKHGTWRGILKGVKRILRCHPWNKGGVDLP